MKKYIFLGSSVTYGSASHGYSFVDMLAEKYQIDYIKEAVSGTTLVDNGPDSYVQRMIHNLDKEMECEQFVCQLSTNDATQGMPLGEISVSTKLGDFDTSTIIGAMEYIICYASTTWQCPVTFYTNIYYDNKNYQKMVEIMYQLKEKWDIGLIDLWNIMEMREIEKNKYHMYMADVIHPTEQGYREWWLPVFEKYFKLKKR
ncbi:MAG: SGNH/GDSL hydrolase family protein [Eubacterium sp.]|nr:SGNH/GDSL hydrolase family protein [Eubacterium sp.]